MADLIVPHGGVSEPVCRTVPAESTSDFVAAAEQMSRVPVSDADLSTVYRWGDGGLSPTIGPMDSATYDRVLEECVIEVEGKKYAWTIPLSLPVTSELAAQLAPGQTVALVNSKDEIIGTLEINDVFEWDKQKYLSKVYLTDRTDHPGADMVLIGDADKTHLLGGSVQVLPQPKCPEFGQYVLSPREVRQLLAEKGWERVVAFQTRNPLHRAHEYALVYGLETLLRAGHNAGACLNPLIGETKGDDVNADVRMKTYETLIDRRKLGEGDSDPELWGARGESVPDRVILLGLDIKMFYGGPKGGGKRGDARHLSSELWIYRYHHWAQARGRALPRRFGDLGRFRRPGDFQQSGRRLADQPAQCWVCCVLRIAWSRGSDGEPLGREAGVHFGQTGSRVADGRRDGRSADYA